LVAYEPEKIILPGVGAIGAALERMRQRNFVGAIEDLVRHRKTPFLGICVGMQMLVETCEEFGHHQGLGWIPGNVSKLAPPRLRVPHVGWNTVNVVKRDDPVLGPLHGRDVYFVHSYAVHCPREFVAATADYGSAFVVAIRRDHILGVQFHPEKSSTVGAELLARFIG
jgi:glutamine amidotransferase